MKRITKKLVLIISMLSSATASMADIIYAPFEADYSLHAMGAKIAKMKRSFTHQQNGEYIYYSETHTTGLAALLYKDKIIEKSTWLLDEDRIKPIQYIYDRSGGKKKRNVEILFDWDAGKISTSVNGNPWQMPIRKNILDKLVYQLAIMKDLINGKQEITYTIADGGKIKVYNFEMLGEELLDTPLGELHTLKLQRHKPNDKSQTTLWCAEALNYLPVMVENIEDNGRKTTAIIESLSGINF